MRFTEKDEFFGYVTPLINLEGDANMFIVNLAKEINADKYVVGRTIERLGRLEDILEKYNIETSVDLEKILNKYFKKRVNKNGKID